MILAADARVRDRRLSTAGHSLRSTTGKHQVHWGKYYASQTFSNAPDDRRIQMGWVQIATPGMPFNQTFSFPHELTLRTTQDGIRLFAEPVKEIEKIHKRKHVVRMQSLAPGVAAQLKVAGELFDVRATFAVGDAKQVGLKIGENRIAYDVASRRLGDTPLSPVDGKVSLQVLIDRNMIEICGNDGRVYVTAERESKGDVAEIEAFAEGGSARLSRLEVHELTSIWPSRDADPQ